MSDKYAALKQVAERSISKEGDIWWNQEQLTRYPDTMEIPGTEANFIEAASPATILELLAERDADKRRIAELKARTLTVKLPPEVQGSNIPFAADGANAMRKEVVKALTEACAAAGISLKIEGE